MADTMIEMDAAQFAKAMAARVVRERARIARRVEEFAASFDIGQVAERGLVGITDPLYALAEEIRTGSSPAAEIVATPPDQQFNQPLADNDPGDGLPPIRVMDDVEEGIALVQGGMFRAGVTGRLRPPVDQFLTD